MLYRQRLRTEPPGQGLQELEGHIARELNPDYRGRYRSRPPCSPESGAVRKSGSDDVISNEDSSGVDVKIIFLFVTNSGTK